MKLHDVEFFLFVLAVVLALGIGVAAGHAVTAANKDVEIMDLQVQLETSNASLTEANIEMAFWKATLKGLADGKQPENVDLKGRPSMGD